MTNQEYLNLMAKRKLSSKQFKYTNKEGKVTLHNKPEFGKEDLEAQETAKIDKNMKAVSNVFIVLFVIFVILTIFSGSLYSGF